MGNATEELNPYLQNSVESVYDMVEEITNVSKEMMLRKSNKRHIVDARKIFTNICRSYIKLTLYEVAKVMGKDHTTIIHYEKCHLIHMHEEEYRRQYSAVAGMYSISNAAIAHDTVEQQVEALHTLEEQFNALQFKMTELSNAIKTERNLIKQIY